jgi:hypothetical protein
MNDRELFKQAKTNALQAYADRAEQEAMTETGRNKRANAIKRAERARRCLALFVCDKAFWGFCGMEAAYQNFVRCGCDVTYVSAL